jgi:hypothetical protein
MAWRGVSQSIPTKSPPVNPMENSCLPDSLLNWGQKRNYQQTKSCYSLMDINDKNNDDTEDSVQYVTQKKIRLSDTIIDDRSSLLLHASSSTSLLERNTISNCNKSLTHHSWWKRQRYQSNADQNFVCHVCQNPYVPYLSLQEEERPIVQKNTIMSYFPSTSSTNLKLPASSLSLMEVNNSLVFDDRRTISIASLPSSPVCGCSFCERTNICHNCQVQCNECHQSFCNFCITSDYSSSIERILCMDCAAVSRQNKSDRNVLDDYSQHMQVD